MPCAIQLVDLFGIYEIMFYAAQLGCIGLSRTNAQLPVKLP